MALPTTQAELEQWCTRQLGGGVIRINVSPAQTTDAIDEALQYWQEYQEAAEERTFIAVQLTAPMVASRAMPLPANVVSVLKVIDWSAFGGSVSGDNLFNFNYHMGSEMAWQLAKGNSGGLVSYAITKQYLAELDVMLSPEPCFRYRQHNGVLHIDSNMPLLVGAYVVVECHQTLDPATNPRIWSDRYLRQLATAYLKRQWASNLQKYENIQLPSGITINGSQMKQEAISEIQLIEQNIKMHMEPLGLIVA
jgi:hypothetical protein